MIRLGVVGTSEITKKFLTAVKKSKRYTLSAVYSRSYEKGALFAETHGIKNVFCDLNKMALSEEIDAVYIATPNSLHTVQSRIFLECGKHIICEKPIAINLREYDELKALADRKNLIYMEAIMPLYTDWHEEVLDSLEKIGKITSARIDFSQRSSRYYAYRRGENPNIFNMSLFAGCLMDIGVYCIYAAVDMFGMPKSISARAQFLENGADGMGNAVFSYDGFDAVLTYSKIGQSAVGSEIIGDEGTLKINSISQYTGVKLIYPQNTIKIVNSPAHEEVMVGEAVRFADFIECFSEYNGEYSEKHNKTRLVHTCMDEIKLLANIKYQIEE